jgi:hypothetical protein
MTAWKTVLVLEAAGARRQERWEWLAPCLSSLLGFEILLVKKVKSLARDLPWCIAKPLLT